MSTSSFVFGVSLCLATAQNLLLAGIVYGVPSLTQVLESRGVYSYLCKNDTTDVNGSVTIGCDQLVQGQVTLAFTASQVTVPFVSVASGFLFDTFGFRVTMIVSAVIFGLGTVALAVVAPGIDWLIFPAFILVGVGGIQMNISNLQLARATPKFPYIMTSVISGCFDASTMSMSIISLLSAAGANSTILFLCFSALGVALLTTSVVIYRPNRVGVEINPTEEPEQTETVDENIQFAKPPPPEPIRSLKDQLLSTDWLLMVMWMVCNQLRITFFLASHNTYVSVITGDKATIDYYARVVNFFFLSSTVISLLPGLVTDLQKRCCTLMSANTARSRKLNTISTLASTSLLGVASCLLMLPKSLEMMIPVYLVVAAHRAFLFTVLAIYIISVFNQENFGIIYTTILCTSALFQFAVAPLTGWMAESRNPDSIHFILIGLLVLSLLHPAVLLIRNWRPRRSG